MDKLKTPVNMLAIAFALSFLDGMFNMGISDNAYIVIGLVELVAIIWMIKVVHKEQ